MADPLNPALRAVSDAVLAVATQRSVEDVLQQLVDSARELAGARYAALGTPDGEGGFTRFLVAGMSDELIASLGPLPRRHGMLAAMIETSEPYLTDDIHAHPRFRGWWPSRHPDMRSFLGVPIVAPEGVIGAFYLTEKEGGGLFDAADQAVIELLAAHAAIAITNAGLYERSRELSMLEARNRLALELHDAVSQKLFSLVLTAEAAGEQLVRDPEAARASLGRLRALAAEALEELRSLIFELRPPELERDGLCGALRKHVEMLRRLHHVEIEVDIDDSVAAGATAAGTAAAGGSSRDREILRVAQEALQNAIRHAAPHRLGVRLGRHDGRLELEVTDDGAGFDPAEPELRARRLGLTSMEERAQLRRHAGDPLRAGRGHHGAAGGAGWLTARSGCCSSTTTRSCARACARTWSCRTGSRSPARPPTAARVSPRPSACAPT
jgi:signal transduction histidine kinase